MNSGQIAGLRLAAATLEIHGMASIYHDTFSVTLNNGDKYD